MLHDLAADGRVVAERNSYRTTLMVRTPGEATERDLSWRDFSQLGQLSRDGKQMLFSEQGDGAGIGITAYLRPVQGGSPIRLGEGLALGLSADAQTALLRVDEGGAHLELVPVGPGRSKTLPRGPLTRFAWGAFVPGAARVIMLASEGEKPERLYLQDVTGGDPRPLAESGIEVQGDSLSPDGSLLAATRSGQPLLIPLDGSPPRELAGLSPDYRPLAWTADGKTLFVRHRTPLPLKLYRYELSSGKLEPFRTLEPSDSAGVLAIERVSLARDGEVYAYETYRLLSDLYVIENLR